jgi:hypothetical protein
MFFFLAHSYYQSCTQVLVLNYEICQKKVGGAQKAIHTVVPIPGRLRWEEFEFQTSLGYKTLSQKTKTKTEKN